MARNLRVIAAFLMVVGLCVFSGACRGRSTDITIGWIGPLTGDAAPYGQSIKKGTDLAVSEINSTGGVNGKKIRIVYEDDQATARLGVAAMQMLLSVYKPPVIIQAAASTVMLANIPIAERNKVVYISPSCSSDMIREEKIRLNAKYIFRTWPSDSYQGSFLAQFVFDKLRVRKSAVLYINNDYGVGLRDTFVKDYQKLGGDVVDIESFDQGATDFRSQLTKIKRANPGVIFLSSHYVEAAGVLKQAKELGLRAQFVADAALFSPEMLKLTGTAAEGLIVANPEWNPESERAEVKKFVSRFDETYHHVPDVYAAAGYDLMMLLADVMRSSGATSNEIQAGLHAIKDFRGVTGGISFDALGEVQSEYSIYQVRSGAFVPLRQ